ncbi:early endosome antigen 1-like [Armigeres subalbatus]|uniref:early endosome antigen 1-like n=1 Tax=Armigeres subalbatus TaxID=124917 RepID=UPI002ED1856A
MSNLKTETKSLKRSVKPKIDTGLSSKHSTLTLIPSTQSRQPSPISRPSSRKPNFNITATKPFNNPSVINRRRPSTSDASTGVPRPSKLSLSTNEEVPSRVHQLGKLPSYLRNKKRPVTATSKIRAVKPETESKREKEDSGKKVDRLVRKFQYDKPKPVMDESGKETSPKADSELDVSSELQQVTAKICSRIDHTQSVVLKGFPPCEGSQAREELLQEDQPVGKNSELADLNEKIKQLQGKIDSWEAECGLHKERIAALEAELTVKCELIAKLGNDVNNANQLSNSHESLSQKNIDELKQQVSNLQEELAQKCKSLIHLDSKMSVLNALVENLKESLAAVGQSSEEKEKIIGILTSKDEQLQKEKNALEQRCEELMQQITTMKEEASAKDAAIAVIQNQLHIKSAQYSELEEKRSEAAALQGTCRKLRNGIEMLASMKNHDDILPRIRTKLKESTERMHSERNKGTRGATTRCGEGVKADDEPARTQDVHLYSEEQIFSELKRNNNTYKETCNGLISIVKRLKKEKLQMREILSKREINIIIGPTMKENLLQKEILNQMYQLFPEEPLQKLVNEFHTDEVEEITSRIIYNEEIISNK